MRKEVIESIRDNYSFYTKLLEERKSVFKQVIEITEVGNNANTLEQTTDVEHTHLANTILFIVNVKVSNYKFFQFKLRCKDLCAQPFFRYDNDGDTHRNHDERIPLSEQQVTTPHFHYYNEKGINIAYKTPHLQNEAERQALEDINLCIKHFCHEANIRLNHEEFPEIRILPQALPFSLTKDDPTTNINFL
ncbi:hypothetical protein I2I11_06890 [Pontibacter sp. 172403-2]|uniref:DUF6978 family protein n=1 Tax=Pontibacter rufus TaxID=2791028 RepID=UPI0018AF9200|nr:hypothetical protein [Pontibacter sp. 172403-2]MBF9253011.1 hypothetical protein [Pontibacter sp. 172403-2]